MKILVSGAGVAGNTLALCLGRAGIPVTLIEREASCLTQGHSIDIDGPGVTVVKNMGLIDELKRRHTGERGCHFEDETGRVIADFPAGDNTSPTSEFEILRGDLAQLLYEESLNYKCVDYILGKTIVEVVTNDDRSVSVRLSDGTILEADILVLSDGQWSKLRTANFSKDSVSFHDRNAYFGLGTIPAIPSDTKMWRACIVDKGRGLSLRPDPYGTTRASVLVIPRKEHEKAALKDVTRADQASQTAVLRRLFSGAGWQTDRILDGLDQSDDFYFQAVVQVRMKKWSTNRIICLGDTAYCPTPFSGAGTTLAMTGAYLLAGELAKLEPETHPSAAFDAYESRFRPYVQKVQDLPSYVPGIMFPDSWFGVYMMRSIIWVLSKLMALPGWMWLFGGPREGSHDNLGVPKYDAFSPSECK